MCGIAGFVDLELSNFSKINNQDVLKSLQHRGPDTSGCVSINNVTFYHTRLQILELTDLGSQPMVSECGRYVLVYNGEIYNHLSLRKSIDKRVFNSNSDTETLLYGLIQFGHQFIQKLNGMFAFAFYDSLENKIILGRDRFGIKPLYYHNTQAIFSFSSEIKVFKDFGLSFNLDADNLEDYKVYKSSIESATPFKGLKMLPLGHYLELNISTNSIDLRPYIDLYSKKTYIKDSEETIVQHTHDLLKESLSGQLIADVPIGFFLSGGLDSSLLAAMAKRSFRMEHIACFTMNQQTAHLGFEDDFPYAQMISTKYGFYSQYVDVPEDIDSIKEINRIVEEPIADLSALNTYYIAQKAKENGVKVLISGLGADEVFGGYRRHVAIYVREKLHKYPNWFIKLICNLPITKNLKSIQRIQKLIEIDNPEDHKFLVSLLSSKKYSEISQLQKTKKILRELELLEGSSLLEKILFLDQKYYLASQNLLYTDKASMQHGVEVRVPYLDNELIDYLSTVPDSLKVNGFVSKYLLKEVAKKYLPSVIIERSKTGFSLPISSLKVVEEFN
ncbi:MAG: asparagine synthase (glutamine-hydrolyzing) [Cytophagales bacterium]